MRKTFFLVVCLLFFALGSLSTVAVQNWTQHIENRATVKVVGVGVYKDINFTVSVTSIDWGIVEPGENKNFSAYVVNRSNVPVTLSMTTENWNLANASEFITLTWDYDGSQIAVDGYVYVTLLLAVDSATSGIDTFSFTIVIVGTG